MEYMNHQSQLEVQTLKAQIEQLEQTHASKIAILNQQRDDLADKLQEANNKATKAHEFNQSFSNLLRTKFLKSFEEKMMEIEEARNRELEEIKSQHQRELAQFTSSSDLKLQQAAQLQLKLKKVLLTSNVKPIEDFIQSRNDPEAVFEAVELLLMKRD